MPADPQQLTPWFDGSVKPARVGWYQRDYGRCCQAEEYQYPDYWDGDNWYVGVGGRKPTNLICNGDMPWRGLTKEQK